MLGPENFMVEQKPKIEVLLPKGWRGGDVFQDMLRLQSVVVITTCLLKFGSSTGFHFVRPALKMAADLLHAVGAEV